MVVVGIPKTIDNDIQILDKTFGFDTAVEEAQRAINAAYIEVGQSVRKIHPFRASSPIEQILAFLI
jgi:6-phosphofructokinase 1